MADALTVGASAPCKRLVSLIVNRVLFNANNLLFQVSRYRNYFLLGVLQSRNFYMHKLS